MIAVLFICFNDLFVFKNWFWRFAFWRKKKSQNVILFEHHFSVFCFLLFCRKNSFFYWIWKNVFWHSKSKWRILFFFSKIKISKAVIMTAFVCLFDRRISKWSNKSMKKKCKKKFINILKCDDVDKNWIKKNKNSNWLSS